MSSPARSAASAWEISRPGGRDVALMAVAVVGVSLSGPLTAMVTAPAAARPITVSTGMRATDSPVSAITTVVPANTTALPAVARARLIASCVVMPVASCAR